MTIPFNQMPPSAKVWIYASDTIITPTQLEIIYKKANPFIENWTAHQNQLKAEFAVLHNCFLVFMVNEFHNEISGCGIDKSVNLVKEIVQETGLNLFNRLTIQLLNNNEITCLSKADVLAKIEKEELTESTLTFNNQVSNKNEFENNWIIPIEKGWFYPKSKLQSV